MKLRSVGWFGLSLLVIVGFGACGTNPGSSFPTAETVAAVGANRGVDLATLNRGRKVFTTTCTECHVAQPIAKLSVAQWQRTVAIMAPRARLTESDRAAVEAYVTAARRTVL